LKIKTIVLVTVVFLLLKQFARNALRIEGENYRPPGFCLEIWGKDNAAEFGVEQNFIFFYGKQT